MNDNGMGQKTAQSLGPSISHILTSLTSLIILLLIMGHFDLFPIINCSTSAVAILLYSTAILKLSCPFFSPPPSPPFHHLFSYLVCGHLLRKSFLAITGYPSSSPSSFYYIPHP